MIFHDDGNTGQERRHAKMQKMDKEHICTEKKKQADYRQKCTYDRHGHFFVPMHEGKEGYMFYISWQGA